MEVGRAAGSGIGRLSGRFGELAPPRVAWELQLRRLLAKAVTEEPRLSHRRPAGRWVAMEAEALRAGHREPVFEPGRLRDRLRPRIVVGIDSSGSISDRQLDLLAAEAGAIARRSGAETHLLGFDESVHTERRLGAAEVARALRDMRMRRGGGTSFVEVLARATALDASIAVILTDLDGPVGPAPNLPVIWAVPAPPAAAPRFGHVLVMDR